MITVIDYLPESAQSNSVYVEIADIIQKTFSDNEAQVLDIIEKYRSPDRNSQLLLNEFGYGYLYDVLTAAGQTTAGLSTAIPVLHFLKGTRSGVVLLLRLLKLDFYLLEWWETYNGPSGYGMGYGKRYGQVGYLTGLLVGQYGLLLYGGPSVSVVNALITFSNSYVLPELVIEYGGLGYGFDYGHKYSESAIPAV